jgi:hypothetical protein
VSPILGIVASQNYPRTISVEYLVIAGGGAVRRPLKAAAVVLVVILTDTALQSIKDSLTAYTIGAGGTTNANGEQRIFNRNCIYRRR